LFNRKIEKGLAKLLFNNFYEVLVSTKFNKEAINILKSKKKLIIIDSSTLKEKNNKIFKSVKSGVLYQEFNSFKISKSEIELVSKKKAPDKILNDLIFAYKVAKHVKSNAIVLVNNKQTLGIGAGQMSRVDSTKIAIMKYKQFFKDKNFVCASDAFFPFTDNIQRLLKLKCAGVIQPGGSINDNKIINYTNKKNASLYFVKNRVFKH
jgi:phosphoribosylaminoimidazolecarboxamide formyltransferase/IMP cyclohydrolase